MSKRNNGRKGPTEINLKDDEILKALDGSNKGVVTSIDRMLKQGTKATVPYEAGMDVMQIVAVMEAIQRKQKLPEGQHSIYLERDRFGNVIVKHSHTQPQTAHDGTKVDYFQKTGSCGPSYSQIMVRRY